MKTQFCYSDYYANISIQTEIEKRWKDLHIQSNYAFMVYYGIKGWKIFLAEQ